MKEQDRVKEIVRDLALEFKEAKFEYFFDDIFEIHYVRVTPQFFFDNNDQFSDRELEVYDLLSKEMKGIDFGFIGGNEDFEEYILIEGTEKENKI